MKILWFTSSRLPKEELQGSGTWVTGMLELIRLYSEDISITIITKGSLIKELLEETPWGKQWVIPFDKNNISKSLEIVKSIIVRENPDLLHVWGTEDGWGLIPFDEICPSIPRLLDMQGIISTVVEGFYGDLTFLERLKCWTLKEMIKPKSSLEGMKKCYQKWINKEEKIIKKFSNIAYQSEWVLAHIRKNNPSAITYPTGIALRKEIYKSEKWSYQQGKSLVVFSTAINSLPLKGLHILYKAFAIVHKYYPDSRLVLGGYKQTGFSKGGFCRMLDKYAKENCFADAIEYKGMLSPHELSEEYRNCSVFVNPSFVESYSLVVAEAMYIGTPTIATYAGAMGELGPNGAVLYFPKGDYTMCAHQILKIFNNRELAEEMSRKAMQIGIERQDGQKIAKQQKEIYNNILKK